MEIERCGFVQSYRQHRLDEDISIEEISEALGFEPSEGDPDKVTAQWEFEADGVPCSIWDYRGHRWSAYGPVEVFEALGLRVMS